MSKTVTRPLKAFLCHASGDKPVVREMYKRLVFEGVDAWLDKEKLLPGQDWRAEVPKAVQETDVVIIFLSKKSISKEGYVQKEIKFALDIAEEKPEGTIFLIPARLEECIVPERLSRWHWVDLFEGDGFTKLLSSLKVRAATLDDVILWQQNQNENLETRIKQTSARSLFNRPIMQTGIMGGLGVGLVCIIVLSLFGLTWKYVGPLFFTPTATFPAIITTPERNNTDPKFFYNPMFDGYRIDWCYTDGGKCGLDAADAWCQLQGYEGAVSSKQDADVGLRGISTIVIGTGTICSEAHCDSFESITCR